MRHIQKASIMTRNLISIGLFLILISTCSIFFGQCLRDISGKIVMSAGKLDSLDNAIMFRMYSTPRFSKWEYLQLDSLGAFRKIQTVIDPQAECHNDCGDTRTCPSKVEIMVLEAITHDTIADTIFDCSQFTFNGDDIILPDLHINY